jgi:hypothetical protein
VFNEGSGGSANLQLGSTILKAGASGGNILNDSGTVMSLGFNLCDDAAGGDGTTGPGGLLNGTADIRNTDPILGPLQNNGGQTRTHSFLPGSPAIDKGTNQLPTSAAPGLHALSIIQACRIQSAGMARTLEHTNFTNIRLSSPNLH